MPSALWELFDHYSGIVGTCSPNSDLMILHVEEDKASSYWEKNSRDSGNLFAYQVSNAVRSRANFSRGCLGKCYFLDEPCHIRSLHILRYIKVGCSLKVDSSKL